MVFANIPIVPNISLVSKTVLVTGGNTGIGLEIARKMYLLGANVTIASRNEAKSLEAIEDIKSGTPIFPGGSMEFLSIDLGDQASVKEFATQYTAKHPSLNILVNNSGFWDMTGIRDEQDCLKTIRVNHFGPFLLTNLLTGAMRKGYKDTAVKSRAVFLSSGVIADLDDLDLKSLSTEEVTSTTGCFRTYGLSKQMNLMTSRALDARENDNVHPGVVDTELFSTMPMWFRAVATPFKGLFMRNTTEGAATALFASIAPEVESDSSYHGAYLGGNGKITLPCKQAQDLSECQRLWDSSVKSLGI